MYPFVVGEVSMDGWHKVFRFPALAQLEVLYRAQGSVDRSSWNKVFGQVATHLHASSPVMGKVYWPLGHTFRGKVCILYPTFDSGQMAGKELDRPLEVHIMEPATTVMAHGCVLAMLRAYKLVKG